MCSSMSNASLGQVFFRYEEYAIGLIMHSVVVLTLTRSDVTAEMITCS